MKILHLDIETAPSVAHVWGLFKQTVSLSQLMESSYMLCWAAKWHREEEVFFNSVRKSSKERMLQEIWSLLDEADVVVHYNGKKFDIPTLNKEFVLAGFTPPSTYKQVDLLSVAKSQFRFTSNKLAYVSEALGLAGKTAHEGHALWVKCMADDPEAWGKMEAYNKQDVVLLEEVYNILLPWIPSHPNVALYKDSGIPMCTNCGSIELRKKGFAYTTVSKFQRYVCKGCGKNVRGRENLADRAGVLMGVH